MQLPQTIRQQQEQRRLQWQQQHSLQPPQPRPPLHILGSNYLTCGHALNELQQTCQTCTTYCNSLQDTWQRHVSVQQVSDIEDDIDDHYYHNQFDHQDNSSDTPVPSCSSLCPSIYDATSPPHFTQTEPLTTTATSSSNAQPSNNTHDHTHTPVRTPYYHQHSITNHFDYRRSRPFCLV